MGHPSYVRVPIADSVSAADSSQTPLSADTSSEHHADAKDSVELLTDSLDGVSRTAISPRFRPLLCTAAAIAVAISLFSLVLLCSRADRDSDAAAASASSLGSLPFRPLHSEGILPDFLSLLPALNPVACDYVLHSKSFQCGKVNGSTITYAEQSPVGWTYEPSPFDETFSVVYAWCNGSYPEFSNVVNAYAKNANFTLEKPFVEERDSEPDQIVIRSQGELRVSIRAVTKNAKHFVNNVVILAGSYPAQYFNKSAKIREGVVIDPITGEAREVPLFLNTEFLAEDTLKAQQHVIRNLSDNNSRLPISVEFHSEFFEDKNALPTFNSMSIESQLPHLSHAVPNGIVIYGNDDFIMAKRNVKELYYTKKNGIQLSLSTSTYDAPAIVKMKSHKEMKKTLNDHLMGMRFSNHVLGLKFGHREHTFPLHTFTAFPLPVAQEVGTIFHDALLMTSFNRRRGNGFNVLFQGLISGYIEEMHRIVLLEGLIGLVIDSDQDGFVSRTELTDFINILFENSASIGKENGVANQKPLPDQFVFFSSKNGIARLFTQEPRLASRGIHNAESGSKFYGPETPISQRNCEFKLNVCGVQQWNKLSGKDLLSLWSKDKFSCGDCVLQAIASTYKADGSNDILKSYLASKSKLHENKNRATPLYNANKIKCNSGKVPKDFKYLNEENCIKDGETADEDLVENGYGVVEFISLLAEQNLLDSSNFKTFSLSDNSHKSMFQKASTDSGLSILDVQNAYYTKLGIHRIQRFNSLAARYRHTVINNSFKFLFAQKGNCEFASTLATALDSLPYTLCVNDNLSDYESRNIVGSLLYSYADKLLGSNSSLPGENVSTRFDSSPFDVQMRTLCS